MKKPKNYWTKEQCHQEALKSETRVEFKKNSPNAYEFARNNNILEEVCSHMIEKKKPPGYWTFEICKELSKDCVNKQEFMKKHNKAYNGAIRGGFLDELFPKKKKSLDDYINIRYGSFLVTKYLGYIKKFEGDKYRRHYFESQCVFCKSTTSYRVDELVRLIARQPTCKCKGHVNFEDGTRKCISCNVWKPATKEYFSLAKNRKFGIYYYCLSCSSKLRASNPKLDNLRKSVREYKKNRMKVDPVFAFRNITAQYLARSITKTTYTKKTKAYRLLGETWEVVRAHIESLFHDGMTWENYGINGWHIDHIVSLSSANTIEEMTELFHYKNIQPMWAKKNMRKGNKDGDWYENRKYD